MQAITNLTQKDTLANIIKGLLLATNIAFLVYFVVLAIYARPHYDDLHFMWKMQEMSIFDYVKDMYFSRSGRFGAYFLNGVVFSIINAVGISWFFPLLFIALGILISSYVATKALPKVNSFWLCNGVMLFYFVYLLTNIDFAVVYWLCAMGYYLKFPIALLLFYFINKQKLNIWQWIILTLAIITVGAGNEAFSPLMLVFLFINGMYYLYSNHYNLRKTFADNRVRRLCIAAATIVVLMVIVVLAPGNYARMSDTTQFHRPASMVAWIKGLSHAGATYHYFLLFYIPYYTVLIALSYLLGIKAKVNNWFYDKFDNKNSVMLWIILLYVIYIFCTILPSVFLFGNFGIQRNYTHTVFMTMLTLCATGFILGYWEPSVEKLAKYMSVVGLVTLFSITVINCNLDFSIARSYAESVDNRMAYCNDKQIDGYKGILEVEPLAMANTVDVKYIMFRTLGKTTSMPSLYYTSENTKAFDEYADHMKRLYKWDFDIVLKQE
ncbi:MAG: hypothetical protein IKW35_08040 [Paludibacteraceae bacterium]|nr:hypothetical protein [Paludibacteraceae bacterium]